MSKCPKCGFECDSEALYCSRCGCKLFSEEEIEINSSMEQFAIHEQETNKNSSNKSFLEQFPNNNSSFEKTRFGNRFNNSLYWFLAFVLIAFIVLSIVFFIIVKQHNLTKNGLDYSYFSQNPYQIFVMKDRNSFDSFADGIKDLEKFLSMYLKYTKDNKEKKNQVIASFLIEMDKLPNLLPDKNSVDKITVCSSRNLNTKACVSYLNNLYKDTSIGIYTSNSKIFMYPDYKKIKKGYYEFLDNDFKKYVDLRLKYNKPVYYELNLLVSPMYLARRISDFEKCYSEMQDSAIKEQLEEIIYYDFKRYIFSPIIYQTQTQEMKKEFEDSYNYFIRNKRNSSLRPVIMSYMDKKRNYTEENFKKDYPFKMYELVTFEQNIEAGTFNDIFSQVRKNFFKDANKEKELVYVYNIAKRKWRRYLQNDKLIEGEFVLSEPDDNNNLSIYNNLYSPFQELNILKFSKLYLIHNQLYIYNSNKLSLYKLNYNGKTFTLYHLNKNDVTSLFPGIEVINIDSFPSYNVVIEKPNKNANYIILSRYSQGWQDYNIKPLKGDINNLILPNMFNINSVYDVTIAFKTEDASLEQFNQDKPVYKITIHTLGYNKSGESKKDITNFDEKTYNIENANENNLKPNIMPKVIQNDNQNRTNEALIEPPKQQIEPPLDMENE